MCKQWNGGSHSGGGSPCKGPVVGATVTVEALDARDGEPGALLWSARTGDRGQTLRRSLPTAALALHTSRGGWYLAEAGGDRIEVGARAMEAIGLGGMDVSITPLSTWETALTRCLQRHAGHSLATAHRIAASQVATRFGAGIAGFDAVRTHPPARPDGPRG